MELGGWIKPPYSFFVCAYPCMVIVLDITPGCGFSLLPSHFQGCVSSACEKSANGHRDEAAQGRHPRKRL